MFVQHLVDLAALMRLHPYVSLGTFLLVGTVASIVVAERRRRAMHSTVKYLQTTLDDEPKDDPDALDDEVLDVAAGAADFRFKYELCVGLFVVGLVGGCFWWFILRVPE